MKMLYLYLDLSNKKYSIATSSIIPTFNKSFSFANGVYSIPELKDPSFFSDDALLCVYAEDTWKHDYNLVVAGQYLSSHGLAQLGKYAPNPVFLRFIENGLAFDNTSVFMGGVAQSFPDPNKLIEPLANLYGEYISTLEVSSTSELLDALFAKIALDKNSSGSSTGGSSGDSDALISSLQSEVSFLKDQLSALQAEKLPWLTALSAAHNSFFKKGDACIVPDFRGREFEVLEAIEYYAGEYCLKILLLLRDKKDGSFVFMPQALTDIKTRSIG